MAPPAEKKKKHSSADHRPISSAAFGGKQQQTLGSFMTAFGKRRNVRVAMKIKHRILRKIWICNDIWMDILPLFDHAQLGLKLALLSPRFNALVDKHFDGKRELTIWRPIKIQKSDGPAEPQLSVRIRRKSVHFPLPDRPLPNKIRFKSLQIDYIDHSVIAFLRANQKNFDKDTHLDLHMFYHPYEAKNVHQIWNVLTRKIWPVFAPNIRHLSFFNGHLLANLRHRTSPTMFSRLNINSINSDRLLPDLVAADGPNATAGQALSKWLITPRKDGKPKQLQLSCCGYHYDTSETTKFVSASRETFLRATTSSASYIIRLEHGTFKSSMSFAPFELMNERTNEMLTLKKEKNNYEYTNADWLLKRCQIGETIQWEDENPSVLSNVNFRFYSGMNCIGPLLSKGQKKASKNESRAQRKKK